jgi:hypothetical protein
MSNWCKWSLRLDSLFHIYRSTLDFLKLPRLAEVLAFPMKTALVGYSKNIEEIPPAKCERQFAVVTM